MSVFRNLIISNAMQQGYDGLCFTAIDANSTVGYSLNGGLTGKDMKTSTDGIIWSSWDGTAITLTNVSDKLYVKGDNTSGLSTSDTAHLKFVMTGKIAGSGNTNSLLDDGDGSTITEIPNAYCFWALFAECAVLTTAPRVPATTLKDYCYRSMFALCPLLSVPPDLPATTLGISCYAYMFYGAIFTTAPALPATILKDYCYEGMFQLCEYLITAPDLPATTLEANCYRGMFVNCLALTYIKIYYTGTFSTLYMDNWVAGVNSSGVLYYNGSDTTVDVSARPTYFTKTSF